MNTKRIRMHRLHTSACLVTEVQRALVGPLRRAFDAAVEAESFPIGINNLQATQAAICHSLKRVLLFLSPNDYRRRHRYNNDRAFHQRTPQMPIACDTCHRQRFLHEVALAHHNAHSESVVRQFLGQLQDNRPARGRRRDSLHRAYVFCFGLAGPHQPVSITQGQKSLVFVRHKAS